MANNSAKFKGSDPQWLMKMAWRDGRAGWKRLSLFMASILLGIAAVVSIHSFSDTLQKNIQIQSKSLMGSDYLIDSRKPPNARVLSIMDSLGGPDASEVNFNSMAYFPKNGGSKFVQVKGMEGGFPFYGSLETVPTEAAGQYQSMGAALIDATLMLQLNVRVGDSIKLGDLLLPVAGSIRSMPGSSGFGGAIAPPVLIPYRYVASTGLIQTGSRVEYQYYFVADQGMDLDQLDDKLDPILDAEGADLDTHLSTSQRLGRQYENFVTFLNLVAFVALLLGCVGIASSVNIYMKEKLRSVAVLKCLGATRRQTFVIFLIQILVMGAAGGVLGSALGILLQESFPFLLGDFLPFEVETSISWEPLAIGLLLGIILSLLFALIPLLSTWEVSPLRVLRVEDTPPKGSVRRNIAVLSGIFLFLFLFSVWLLRDWQYALAFLAGVLVTFIILTGINALFTRLIKGFFPRSWGFCARQSLLNLFRPQNQTMTLILAIGVGTFLISTLYFTKDMLLAKLSLENDTGTPNIILLDVQNDQKEQVAASLDKVIDNIPIVTMRVHSLKGRLANDIRKDSLSGINEWVLNHEFRVTYRDSLIGSESLAEGTWVKNASFDGVRPVPISIAESVAREGKLAIGDTVVFNVQGVLMPTTVANIRKVDWSRMQLNFSIVFPLGVLESAPQFNILSTHTPDEASSARLQSELIRQFPNISILDFRQILNLIENVLRKISWVINFMAFFSIFTGIVVLIGAVRTSKYQRIRENVLLRTLGATGRQIRKITALEYLYLGVLGSISGILLSLLGSQVLAYFVFDLAFVPSAFPFLVLFPGITLLVLAIGLANSRGILKSPPLQVLRKEVL